jgi:hypothetical protein
MLDVLYLPESLSFPVLPQDLLLNVCISLDLPGPSHFFSGFSCISREYAYISHGSASTLDLYLPQTSFYSFLYLLVSPCNSSYRPLSPRMSSRTSSISHELTCIRHRPLYLSWMSHAKFSCIFLDLHISLYLPVTPFIFLDLHVPPQDLLLCPVNLLVSPIEPLYLL